MGGDGVGVGSGRGAGDCDDATVAIGAQLMSVGFPVRIAVTAPPGAPMGNTFAHVFPQALIPGHGWVTVDPVLHPNFKFGKTPDHSRIAFYDVYGRLVGKRGNIRGKLSGYEPQEDETMNRQMPYGLYSGWQEVGLAGIDAMSEIDEPADWRENIQPGFGAYAETMGIIDNPGLAVEPEWDIVDGQRMARTPMLELAPEDYEWVRVMRRPYDGMVALGDTGQSYIYDGQLGFFRKLLRKARKAARRVGRRIKKVIKKIPGGKYLVKLGKKVWKISKKFLKPLAKYVGKYASKLAPVAALIPGYGPAIAAGLYAAGKVANLVNNYGVKIVGAAGKLRKLKFASGKAAKLFRKALKRAAKREKRRMRNPKYRRKVRRQLSRMKRRR